MLECKQCEFSSSSVADFRHHMYKEHNAKKPRFHRCERCLEKYYSFDELETHRNTGNCSQVQLPTLDDASGNDNNDQPCNSSDPVNPNPISEIKVPVETKPKPKTANKLLPDLKLRRLTAEKIADHCKTVVSSANSRRYFICPFCGGKYSHRSSLITHIKSLHEKLFQFKCSLCNDNKEFNGKVLLNNHILYQHTNVRPFICSICGISYAYKSVLITHIPSCLKKSSSSGIGDVDLNKRSSLNAYVTEEKIEVPCSLCKAVCSNYLALIEHMKRHRNVQTAGKIKPPTPIKLPAPGLVKKESDEIVYACKLCSKRFPNFRRLNSHNRRAHSHSVPVRVNTSGGNGKKFIPGYIKRKVSEKVSVCEICSKVFSNLQKLVTHKRMTHRISSGIKKMKVNTPARPVKVKLQSTPKEELHFCELCPKSFSNLQKLATHKRMTHKIFKNRPTSEEHKVIPTNEDQKVMPTNEYFEDQKVMPTTIEVEIVNPTYEEQKFIPIHEHQEVMNEDEKVILFPENNIIDNVCPISESFQNINESISLISYL